MNKMKTLEDEGDGLKSLRENPICNSIPEGRLKRLALRSDDPSYCRKRCECPRQIVIPTGAYPDFLPRRTRQGRVCAFP
jgi:hypothetical protein